MIYNSKIEIDKQKAMERIEWLIKNERKFEIKEIKHRRTLKQNAYFHLILSYFALEVGETLEFIKQEIFKKKVNPDTFRTERKNPKSGKIREDWKSTADLDTKQLSECIDRFKHWTVKNTGIRLPDANENEFLDYIQNEIELQKQWL